MFIEYEKHVISYIALYCSNACSAGQGLPYVPMAELTGNNRQRAYTKAGLASEETLSSSCNSCKMLNHCVSSSLVSLWGSRPLPQSFPSSRTEELGFGDELKSLLHTLEKEFDDQSFPSSDVVLRCWDHHVGAGSWSSQASSITYLYIDISHYE
jgi:hypothetical protein